MKTTPCLLFVRGLMAAVLLSLGFAGAASAIDPLMADSSREVDSRQIAGGGIKSCNLIEKPGDRLV